MPERYFHPSEDDSRHRESNPVREEQEERDLLFSPFGYHLHVWAIKR